jgi:hypothetical protein
MRVTSTSLVCAVSCVVLTGCRLPKSHDLIERNVDIGQIEQWRLRINVVLPNQVSSEQLPVIVCLYQAGGAEGTVIDAI